MASSPVFIAAGKTWIGTLTTAETTRDNPTTNVVTVVPAEGSVTRRIDFIEITAQGANTAAGSIRLYINDGTTNHLWKEILVTAFTPDGTAIAGFTAQIDLRENPLDLVSAYSLRAVTHQTKSFKVIVRGGEY